MKSFLKKSAISLLVMGMAGSSYAAMSHNNSTWSPRLNGWFIGVDGLDLRPQNGDLDFVTVTPAGVGGSYYNQAIDPSRQWSWRIYGGIKFTENDDITLSWMRMRANNSSSLDNSIYDDVTPRWSYNSDNWAPVYSKVTFNLDDVYGVWGHTINFNNPWSVRYAAGVEYAKLDSDLTVNEDYYESNFGTVGYQSTNDLKGVGPRVELDMTYHLPYNFALFANTNAALLVSDRKIALNANRGYSNGDTDFTGVNFSTRHVLVPKMGMRLGVSYGYIFGQSGGEGGGSASTLTVDAGWQVESFIHAIERTDGDYDNEDFVTTTTSNFGDQGFFIGVKFSSDWL